MSMAPPPSCCPGVTPRRAFVALLAAGCVTACTTATSTSSIADLPEGERAPAGFDRRIGLLTSPSGDVVERCLWIADTTDLRMIGMMGADTFGNADGMAFVQKGPTTGQFWMKDTLLDLSIVFYGDTGLFLDSYDMTVCTSADSSACTRYPTPSSYLIAVETPSGALGELGFVAGSTFKVTNRSCLAATHN